MTPSTFRWLDEPALRRRKSAKWSHYPEDVLPAWVAEMDVALAPPVEDALRVAVESGDTGYPDPRGFGEELAAWMGPTFGHRVDASQVHLVADVMTGVSLLLGLVTRPLEGVVIDTPIYPPFPSAIEELGRVVVPVPLARDEGGRAHLDLDAIERAYAAGARAHLLCSPHNPTGICPPRADLERLAALAHRFGVWVVSDEIHAPLVHRDGVHVPFASLSPDAARRSFVLTAASKAWNVAGLKAAAIVATGAEAREVVGRLPFTTPYHAGHLGVLAARAAFSRGEPWRREMVSALTESFDALERLLSERLPDVRLARPDAGYLAWLDCRALGLGDDPARTFLGRGRVALSPGPTFGEEGKGFCRLNVATSPSLLDEAVARMARAL